MAEFSLLQYMGVDDITRPKTKEELEREERKRKMEFNEFQLQAHRAQELKQRARQEMNHTGRANRSANANRDNRHHYGNFWFAGGQVADSHIEVGKSKPLPKEIKRPNRIGRGDDDTDEEPTFRHEPAFAEDLPLDEHAKSMMILRPREAPPRPNRVKDEHLWSPPPTSAAEHGRSMEIKSFPSPSTPQPQHKSLHAAAATPPPASSNFHSAHKSPSAARQAQMQRLARSRTPPARSAPMHSSFRSTGTPYAEHYDANALYDVPHHPGEQSMYAMDAPGIDASLQYDRDGVPRGRHGIDFEEGQAREAQRLAEEMRRNAAHSVKKQQQAEMKQQLDELVHIKRRRKQEEREIDDRTVYGYTLPIPQTDRERQVMQRQERASLEAEWAVQAKEIRARKAAEAEYYKPQDEDWNAVNSLIHQSESAATNGQSTPGGQKPWLRAWQEHQQTEDALRKAAAEEKIRREMETIGPNVLNYSSRILAAEQQRKAAQQDYRAALDDQVRQRQYDKRARIAENHERDARYHRPPFGASH